MFTKYSKKNELAQEVFQSTAVQSNFLATFLELDLCQAEIRPWPLSENNELCQAGLRRLLGQPLGLRASPKMDFQAYPPYVLAAPGANKIPRPSLAPCCYIKDGILIVRLPEVKRSSPTLQFLGEGCPFEIE